MRNDSAAEFVGKRFGSPMAQGAKTHYFSSPQNASRKFAPTRGQIFIFLLSPPHLEQSSSVITLSKLLALIGLSLDYDELIPISGLFSGPGDGRLIFFDAQLRMSRANNSIEFTLFIGISLVSLSPPKMLGV